MSGVVLLAGCGPHWAGDGLEIPACPAGLLPGELVITEVMASPGDDAGGAERPGDGPGEWIEIFSAAGAPIDLRGVVITVDDGVASSPRRHVIGAARIEPGAYFVLGRDRAQLTAVPVDYAYGEALGPLPGDGARVTLRCDVIEVDAVAYPAAAPGAAVGMDGAQAPDAMANDEVARWCAASQEFAPGLLGSPGASNQVCAGAPGDVPPDPDACEEGGAVRAIVAPAVGDLVITELMPNPEAVPDAQGEWLELYVARDVDLNGLTLGADAGDAGDIVIAGTACVRAAAGSHLVLAASMDPATNGGLAPIAELAVGLRNTSGALTIGRGQSVLDTITWTSAPAGASLALDPAYRSPVHNDLAERWCASAAMPYGSGDLGTPGAGNAPCNQPPPTDGGPGDPGDSGPGPGEPPAGMCDDAGVLRPIVPPPPGTVRITEIMADPAAAPDSTGEWIELRFGAAADLNGLELGKTPGQVLATIASPQCLPVPEDARVILARSADPARNGGLPRVDAGLGLALLNGGDALFVGAGGAVLDAVTHGAAAAGVSASLDEGGTTWCPSPAGTTYGSGDRGSPGVSNPACAPPAPPVVRRRFVR